MKEMLENESVREWERFIEWCKINDFNPRDSKVLHSYVEAQKEGKWDYVF